MTKVKSKLQKKIYRLNNKKLFAVIIIVILSILGVNLLIASHAQSPYVSSEAESGTQSPQVAIQSDSNASGGKYVKFGATLQIHIANGQLVDGTGKSIRLLGADESSTESYCLTHNMFSLGPLDASEAAGIASWHMNAIRIPINEECWLGKDNAPAAYSGQNYKDAIIKFVTALNNAGIYAILDLHCAAPKPYLTCNGGPYTFHMPDWDYSPAFWTDVASTFKSNPAVLFDLYNEPDKGAWNPTNADWTCWLSGCQDSSTGQDASTNPATAIPFQTAGIKDLIKAVRDTGATQPIIVGTLADAGDPCGIADFGGNGGVCQVTNPTYMPDDPLHQMAIDFHNYGAVCSSTNCWNTTLQALKAANLPWIATEFGEFDCTPNAMNTFMTWADLKQNNMSYMAWTWMINDGPLGGYTSCTTGGLKDSVPENTELISKWDGTPSLIAPQGANYKSHLLSITGN